MLEHYHIVSLSVRNIVRIFISVEMILTKDWLISLVLSSNLDAGASLLREIIKLYLRHFVTFLF